MAAFFPLERAWHISFICTLYTIAMNLSSMIDAEVLSFNDECNNEPEPLLNVTVDQTDEEASQDRPQVVPRKLSKAMETRK